MYTSIHRTSQLPADCAQITYTFRSIFFSYFFPSSDEAVISAEVSTYISYWKRHHEILIRQEVTLCESLTKLGYTPSFKFFTIRHCYENNYGRGFKSHRFHMYLIPRKDLKLKNKKHPWPSG